MRTLTRLHQVLLVLAILSGCYAPEVRDCTVSCSSPDECAGGQVCNAQGYCADEGITCGNSAVDAGDTRVMLRVQVMGKGRVDVIGASSCGGAGPSDCMIPVPKGPVTLNAVSTGDDFDRWTAGCTTGSSTCSVTVDAPMTVGARFE
ncbi:MAG: hypothetical protein H0T46_09050 [Deltaproteobacteria bacterium]|nr:hypothetical protein [Deltaproteobacteria bacterium]